MGRERAGHAFQLKKLGIKFFSIRVKVFPRAVLTPLRVSLAASSEARAVIETQGRF